MDDLMEQLRQLREDNAKLRGEVDEQPVKESRRTAVEKAWTTTIYNADGEVLTKKDSKGKIIPMIKGFDRASGADKWGSLRLAVDGFAGCYATIEHMSMPIKITVDRDAAMGHIYGQQPGKPGAVQHAKSNSKHKALGFGVKVHQTRVEFSCG